MYLCAEGSCNALRSIQALPWDCIWLMGAAAAQRGLLYWTSSSSTIKVSAIRIKLLCARSRAFPACGSGRNTPRNRAASGLRHRAFPAQGAVLWRCLLAGEHMEPLISEKQEAFSCLSPRATDELSEALRSHAAAGGNLEGAELRPRCCKTVSERERVKGLGTAAVAYPGHPGTCWQGCQAWPGHQELVTPSPEPCSARVAMHMMARESESPKWASLPSAEMPVLQRSAEGSRPSRWVEVAPAAAPSQMKSTL